MYAARIAMPNNVQVSGHVSMTLLLRKMAISWINVAAGKMIAGSRPAMLMTVRVHSERGFPINSQSTRRRIFRNHTKAVQSFSSRSSPVISKSGRSVKENRIAGSVCDRFLWACQRQEGTV